MDDLEFEWDDGKAAANLRKHGVGFPQATLAFRDQTAIEWPDLRVQGGEERVILLGQGGGELLIVVFVERRGRYRLISARRATRRERDRYRRQVIQDR